MPNVSPKGLWGRVGPDIGTPAAPVALHGTIPGENTPRTVREVWASGADGVPQLVWIAAPAAPTGVSAAYQNNGTVVITWMLPSVPDVETYEVKRPNGTIVGTVSATTSTITDTSPQAVSGSYSVRGYLNGEYSAPAYSNSLNITTGPTSLAGSYSTSTLKTTLTWAAPALGTPTSYEVRRNGTLIGTVPGSTLSYVDAGVYPGELHTYSVTAKVNAASAGSAEVQVAVAARACTDPYLVAPSFYYPQRRAGTYTTNVLGFYFDWIHPPAGSFTGFEVQRYIGGSWVAAGIIGPWPDDFGPYPSSVPEAARVRALSNGGPSDWITSPVRNPSY